MFRPLKGHHQAMNLKDQSATLNSKEYVLENMCTDVDYIIPHQLLPKTCLEIILNLCNNCKADVSPHARINLH